MIQKSYSIPLVKNIVSNTRLTSIGHKAVQHPPNKHHPRTAQMEKTPDSTSATPLDSLKDTPPSESPKDSESLLKDSESSETSSKTSAYGTKTASGNARIFKCSECNRAFTREEHLTRHTLLTHNKLKPFICGICTRPFSRRDLLLRHAKNLHQGSELAVSRIRRLYRKKGDSESSNDEDEYETSVNDIESGENKNETFESLDDLESHQKKRLKMSVNMLVS